MYVYAYDMPISVLTAMFSSFVKRQRQTFQSSTCRFPLLYARWAGVKRNNLCWIPALAQNSLPWWSGQPVVMQSLDAFDTLIRHAPECDKSWAAVMELRSHTRRQLSCAHRDCICRPRRRIVFRQVRGTFKSHM